MRRPTDDHGPGLSRLPRPGLDDNTVERAIRATALGRENAPFAGSDGRARHRTVVAGLAAIAKLNGVKPQVWLTDMLGRVVSGRAKAHELERLLPWAWQAERFAAAWTPEHRHVQTTLAMRWQRAGGKQD